METEVINKAPEQEPVKETTTQPNNDLADIKAALASINERLDKQEKESLTQAEIRKIAERNVIEAKVEEEVDAIKLENQTRDWEKQKTRLELRNWMWDQLTDQFLNDEIPRTHLRAAMLDRGWHSGLGQMLSLALFRYLAPNNGVNFQDLNAISLTAGESSFGWRNQPRNIIRAHSR